MFVKRITGRILNTISPSLSIFQDQTPFTTNLVLTPTQSGSLPYPSIITRPIPSSSSEDTAEPTPTRTSSTQGSESPPPTPPKDDSDPSTSLPTCENFQEDAACRIEVHPILSASVSARSVTNIHDDANDSYVLAPSALPDR